MAKSFRTAAFLIAGIVVSSIPSGAYADTSGAFSPTGERIISDPMYLPLKGQLYGSTDYSFITGGYKDGLVSLDTDYHAFTQTLAYGVLDNLTVSLAAGYSFDFSGWKVLGTKYTSQAAGFENPVFGATYRVIDQRHNQPVSADLTATYSPDLLTSTDEDNLKNGTEASGRHVVKLKASVGREMKALTLKGFAGASYNGERNFKNSLSSSNTEASYWDYSFGLASQYRLTDRLSVNGSAEYTVRENTTQNTWFGSSVIDTPDTASVSAALNYHLVPNRVVGQVSYGYIANVYSPRDNDNYHVIGARLMYVFN